MCTTQFTGNVSYKSCVEEYARTAIYVNDSAKILHHPQVLPWFRAIITLSCHLTSARAYFDVDPFPQRTRVLLRTTQSDERRTHTPHILVRRAPNNLLGVFQCSHSSRTLVDKDTNDKKTTHITQQTIIACPCLNTRRPR